jgi:hypothetical protein
MSNPFTDAWLFVIGQISDHDALGAWKWLFVVLFLALIAASLVIALKNWADDPLQRTGTHLATWLMRVLVGCMWFQGMLWKLPFSTGNGLHFWMEQMAQRAAFQWHRDLVANVLLPYFSLLNPLIFLAELTFAIGLILGLCVRLVGQPTRAAVHPEPVARHLQPEHRPVGMAVVLRVSHHAQRVPFFGLHAAGRSLGLDALLRRHPVGPLANERSSLTPVYHAVS